MKSSAEGFMLILCEFWKCKCRSTTFPFPTRKPVSFHHRWFADYFVLQPVHFLAAFFTVLLEVNDISQYHTYTFIQGVDLLRPACNCCTDICLLYYNLALHTGTRKISQAFCLAKRRFSLNFRCPHSGCSRRRCKNRSRRSNMMLSCAEILIFIHTYVCISFNSDFSYGS